MREPSWIQAKKKGKRWTALTAYDARISSILEDSGVDFILVGDSAATVVLGYGSTRQITMDEMIFLARAVRRGAPNSFVIGDMPYEAVQSDAAKAVRSAKRFLHEGGCDAVKLEWNSRCLSHLKALRAAGIPVMGHLGLTPQSVSPRKGFKIQATQAKDAEALLRQALLLEKKGIFSLVLECVPSEVAKSLRERLGIPVIGIGAGIHCDGQILVYHDLVGAFEKFKPRFVAQYGSVAHEERKAVARYVREVTGGVFPKKENSFFMKREELMKYKKALDAS